MDQPRESDIIRRRIAECERQLDELRAALRSAEAAEGEPEPAAPPAAPPTAPPVAPPTAPPTAPPVAPPVAAGGLQPIGARVVPPPPPRPDPRSLADAERFVGGRLLAWLGAIVVIVALGIFGHLAYRQGWFRVLGPEGRLAIGYLLAVGFLVLAEVIRRRSGSAAAVGAGAAGVAGLSIATTIGVTTGVIRHPELALLLISLGTIVGCVATLRFDSLALAVIAIIGGYGAPAFADGYRTATPTQIAVHLTLCLATALVPAILRHERFHPLRFIALIPHCFFGAIWVVGRAWTEPMLVVIFCVGWWVMIVAAAHRAASRGLSSHGNAALVTLASIAAASITVPVIAALLPPNNPLSFAPLLMAGLAVAASFLLPSVDPALCETAEERAIADASGGLARTLRALAVLLAALAIVPWLSSGSISIAWAMIAVAVLELDRRALLPRSGIACGVMLIGTLLAGLITVVMAATGGGGFAPGAAIALAVDLGALGTLSLDPERWALVGAVAAGVWCAIRSADDARFLRGFAAIIALTAWIATSFAALSGPLALIVASAAALSACAARRPPLPALLLGATALASLLWIVTTGLVASSSRVWVPDGLISSSVPIAFATDCVIVAMWIVSAAAAAVRVAGQPGASGSSVSTARATAAIIAVLLSAVLAARSTGRMTDGLRYDEAAAIMAAVGSVAALAVLVRGLRRAIEELVAVGGGLMVAASAGWLIVTIIAASADRGALDGRVLLNAGFASGVVLLLTQWAALWLLGIGANGIGAAGERTADLVRYAMPAILLAIVSREIARLVAMMDPALVQPALSLIWGLTGVGLIALGFIREQRAFRWVGLVALGCVACKVLILDLGGTNTLLRVGILLGVGILLVLVSASYAKRSGQPLREPPRES